MRRSTASTLSTASAAALSMGLPKRGMEAVMSPEIRALVDRRWEEYGL